MQSLKVSRKQGSFASWRIDVLCRRTLVCQELLIQFWYKHVLDVKCDIETCHLQR